MAVRRLRRPDGRVEPRALALRLERAEAVQLARSGAPGRAGALGVAGGIAVSKGPGSPFSAALGLGLSGAICARDVDRVEAHLGALGGEVRIEVCSHAHPSLAAELARRGYRVERFLQVLWTAVTPPPAARAAGVRVRPIHGGEERAWGDAFALAHLGAVPASDADAEDLVAIAHAEGNVCFAAFAESPRSPLREVAPRGSTAARPVAVAIVSTHGRVATFSGAGVLPAWRGRGLHLALVSARLRWSASSGCDIAAAVTEPGGPSQRTLERAGFRVAYPKAVMLR